jgi:hypothetical protein
MDLVRAFFAWNFECGLSSGLLGLAISEKIGKIGTCIISSYRRTVCSNFVEAHSHHSHHYTNKDLVMYDTKNGHFTLAINK